MRPKEWLSQGFIESFYHENPDFDPYAPENLTRVFSHDLQRRRGLYDKTRNKISAAEAERTRIGDLESWQKDPSRLALGICRHFAGDRGEVLVVVMDNVDRLNLSSQHSVRLACRSGS